MFFDRAKPLDQVIAAAGGRSLKRTLGVFQLTMLGVGGVIGTGIFVLTAEAAQKAGPGMMLSFVLAGLVCGVAALCYAELASMVPAAGSAYTYVYAVIGELPAWMVGWALILEYAVGASAVASSWSGYMVGLARSLLHLDIPPWWVNGPFAGGYANLPALAVVAFATGLLVAGTRESARVNAVLVSVKIAALAVFVALALPVARAAHFTPFMPAGAMGVAGAAGSIFFAYVGFDAICTAGEETRDPQRNVPLCLMLALAICTAFYLLVAAGAIGSPLGAQPVRAPDGGALSPGTLALARRCATLAQAGPVPLSCSHEALAHVLRAIGWRRLGDLIGLAAALALPSVVLTMMFGQTRVFFAMACDGLLPPGFARVHPVHRTPHVVTYVTGLAAALAAAFLPVGKLADYSNSGTLFAFVMVAVAVLALRRTDPDRPRPFRVPAVRVVAPLAILGCCGLYLSLSWVAMLVLPGWGLVGLAVYFLYGRSRSLAGRAAEAA